MKVAITGGTGFVGGAAGRELARRGHEVVLLSRRTGADVGNANAMTAALAGCQAVLHCAGINRELDVDRDGHVAERLVEYPAVRGEPADRTQLEMLVVHARRMDFHQLAAKGGEPFPAGSSVSPAFRIACAPYRDATGSTYTFFQSSSEHGSAQAILRLDGDRVVQFDSVEVRRSR